jgi:hypothetical protein
VLAKIKRIQDQLELLPHAVRHNILSLAARKVKEVKGGPRRHGSAADDGDRAAHGRGDRAPQAAVASMPIYINALVSPDGKAGRPSWPTSSRTSGRPTSSRSTKGLHRSWTPTRMPDVDIYLGGITMHRRGGRPAVLEDAIFFGVALLIILLVQYWSFRSVQGMVLPMVTGLLSVVWSLGLMGLLGVHLDPLNTTTPILVLAVAAGTRSRSSSATTRNTAGCGPPCRRVTPTAKP